MSEHSFETREADGTALKVVTGWEPERKGFHLSIARGQRTVFDQRVVGVPGRRRDFSQMIELLGTFGINLPRKMIDEVVMDGLCEVDEKRVQWQPDGTALRQDA